MTMNITIPEGKSLQDLHDLAQMMLRKPHDYSEESLDLARALAGAAPLTGITGFRLEVVPGTNPDRLALKHPDGQTVKYYGRSLLESRGHTDLPPVPASDITVTIPANATDAQILAAVREVLG